MITEQSCSLVLLSPRERVTYNMYCMYNQRKPMSPNHNMLYHSDEDFARTVGYDLDGRTSFPDSTPSSVATKVEETIDLLPQESVSEFLNFCVVAAANGKRRMLDQYLANVNGVAFSNFIRQHWVFRNQINMTALTLAGHCIMAATGPYSSNPTIMTFRSRIRADHIWDSNLRYANLSHEKRRILEQKRDRYGKCDAVAAGSRIIYALARRQARQQGSQGIHTRRRIHLSRRGLSGCFANNYPPLSPKLNQEFVEWSRSNDLQCDKNGETEEKQIGCTASTGDDNKEPPETGPVVHSDQSDIRRRSNHYYYKRALWYLVLSMMLSTPAWIALILVWNSTRTS